MSVLERAKEHFRQLPVQRIEVPEWGEGGQPLVVTFGVLTVHDRERIYRERDGQAPSGSTILLRAVMLKACDAEGKQLFSEMDENHLRHGVSGDVLGRVANAILYGVGLTDAKGKARSLEDQKEDAKNG